MGKFFNKTFFKFLAGFALILFFAFVSMFLTASFVAPALGGEHSAAVAP